MEKFSFAPRGEYRPRVSVCIPCHNYAAYVGVAIESILGQTLAAREREIIVVDDASTDGSWSVISRYVSEGVRALRHDTNSGHIRTYHDAMSLASGDAIVLLSADDLAVDPDALRLQLDALDRHPAGLVFSDFDIVDENGRGVGGRDIAAGEVIPGAEAFRRLMFENFIQHSGTMVRREQFETTGGYDTRLFHSVDWELWLRIAARSDLAHVGRRLYAYRVHRRNMHSTSGYENSIREVATVLEIAAGYGPPKARGLVPLALSRHLTNRAAVYLGQRRYRLAAADLLAAGRLRPTSLVAPTVVRGLVGGMIRSARQGPPKGS